MNRFKRALVAICFVGSALVVCSAQPASGDVAPWWNANYANRSLLSIQTIDALPSGYTIFYRFDHAALAASGKALASGNDVRIVRYNGSTWTEIDRVLAVGSSWNGGSTQIAFRTQAAISASTTNTQYYMYYGYAGAGSPPATPLNVYDQWDDFEDGTIDPAKWNVEVPGGGATPAETGGKLKIAGTTGFWGANVNGTNGLTGPNVIVEATIEIVTQTSGAQMNSEYGVLDNSLAIISSENSTTKKWQSRFFSPWVEIGPTNLQGPTFVPTRVGVSWTDTGVARMYENDQLMATRTGAPNSYTSTRLNYHPASAGTFDVRFDDYVVRKWVPNEPTVSPAAEINITVSINPEMLLAIAAHAGTCNAIAQSAGTSSSATAASLGRMGSGSDRVVAQDVQVTTNAAQGFTVYIQGSGTLSRVGGGGTIAAASGSNASPGAFPTGNNAGFGYTTSDATLGTGTANRFTSPSAQWAAITGSNQEFTFNSTGPANVTECIAYRARASTTIPPGVYQATVMYTAVSNF